MRTVTNVRIGLENCECFDFNPNLIDVTIKNTSSDIFWSSDSLFEFTACEFLALEISSLGNNRESDQTQFDDKQLPFDRLLQYPDIVSVELFYSDKTSIDVYVDWKDKDQRDCNQYQTMDVDEAGNLRVVVSKNETVESVFGEYDRDQQHR